MGLVLVWLVGGFWEDGVVIRVNGIGRIVGSCVVGRLMSVNRDSPTVELLVPLTGETVAGGVGDFSGFLGPVTSGSNVVSVRNVFSRRVRVVGGVSGFSFSVPFVNNNGVSGNVVSLRIPCIGGVITLGRASLRILGRSLVDLGAGWCCREGTLC